MGPSVIRGFTAFPDRKKFEYFVLGDVPGRL